MLIGMKSMRSIRRHICKILMLFLILDGILNGVESSGYDPVTPSSEKRLIKQLISNYEKAGKIGRPVENTKQTIVVGFGLSLFQLMDLDEKNQVLTVNVWTKYTWIDQLLQWNPGNYSNIREVRIPPRLIWTPDIVLYNYGDNRLKEQRDVMLNVNFEGRVFWSPPAIFKSSCAIDIRNFPFDYQYCYLRFASWTQHSEQLDLQFLDNRTEVDVDQYTPSNEWTLLARPARRFIMMSQLCGKKIPDLTFFLFLKRNPAFYAYLLVFPCILLSLLTSVIFWLPPQISAKMLLSMNIFLAFSLLLKFLAGSTPSASTIVPFLGYYYCLNMTLLSVSTFLSTIIVNVHTYSHRHGGVPQWLVKYVNLFATPLSITRPSEDEDDPNEKLSVMEARILKQRMMQKRQASGWNPEMANQAANAGYPWNAYPPEQAWHDSNGRLRYPFRSCEMGHGQFDESENATQMKEFVREQIQQQTALSWSQSTHTNFMDDWGSTKRLTQPDEGSNASGQSQGCCFRLSKRWNTRRATIQINTSLSDLREALKNLTNKIAKKDAAAKQTREWRMVVMTMDRMFFWLYLISIICAGFYLLIPRGQTHSIEEVLRMHAESYREKNRNVAAECLLPKSQLY